jgi:competence protein ComEC
MRRPALFAVLFYIGGILFGRTFDFNWIYLVFLIFLFLLLSIYFYFKANFIWASIFIFFLLFSWGVFRLQIATKYLPANHISNFTQLNHQTTLKGKIVEEPDVREDRTNLLVEASEIFLQDRFIPTSGQIILKIKEPTFRFNYGDSLYFSGILYQPQSPSNPGIFDYKKYLQTKEIFGLVTIENAWQIDIIEKQTGNFFLAKIIIPLRNWISKVFSQNLSGDQRGLLLGFLLGDSRGISKQVYGLFRDTGTLHLLAVSGFNVGLILFLLIVILKLFKAPLWLRTVIGILSIVVFSNLVNNQPSVVRASIMATVALVGAFLYRDLNLLNILSFAALVMLFFFPLWLFEVGFQLSFAAVLGIIIIYPKLNNYLFDRFAGKAKFFYKWIIAPILVSLAVELAVFPLLAYYFNFIPLVTIIANLVLVPLTSLIVYLGCAQILVAVFSVSFSGIIAQLNYLLLSLDLISVNFFSHFPLAKLKIASPSIIEILIYYLVLWFLLNLSSHKKIKLFVFISLVLLNIFIWGPLFSSPKLKITFLDVGANEVLFLESPSDEKILFNTGGIYGNSDFGERVIIPFLNKKGVEKLQKVLLTDIGDNLVSLSSITKEIEVEKILLVDSSGLNLLKTDLEAENKTPHIEILNSSSTFFSEANGLRIQIHSFINPNQEKLNLIEIHNQKTKIAILQGEIGLLLELPEVLKKIKGCNILALPEAGTEIIEKTINMILPLNVIFTRHSNSSYDYLKNLPQKFPPIHFYRIKTQGAIEVDVGKRDLTITSFLKKF